MKKRAMTSLLLLLLISLSSLVLLSCGGNHPEQVARKFLTALYRAEYDKAARYGTEETQQLMVFMTELVEQVPEEQLMDFHLDSGLAIKILSSEIDGDKAAVTYQVGDHPPETMDLLRLDGRWLVDFDKGY